MYAHYEADGKYVLLHSKAEEQILYYNLTMHSLRQLLLGKYMIEADLGIETRKVNKYDDVNEGYRERSWTARFTYTF